MPDVPMNEVLDSGIGIQVFISRIVLNLIIDSKSDSRSLHLVSIELQDDERRCFGSLTHTETATLRFSLILYAWLSASIDIGVFDLGGAQVSFAC